MFESKPTPETDRIPLERQNLKDCVAMLRRMPKPSAPEQREPIEFPDRE